jgi:hypothetical protein
MYLGVIYIFPLSVLFGISIFLDCVRELSAQLEELKEGQGTAIKQAVVGDSSLPSSPLLRMSREFT